MLSDPFRFAYRLLAFSKKAQGLYVAVEFVFPGHVLLLEVLKLFQGN